METLRVLMNRMHVWQKMGVVDNSFAGKAYEEHKAYEGKAFEEGNSCHHQRSFITENPSPDCNKKPARVRRRGGLAVESGKSFKKKL